jgi:hypothetical protein
MRVAGEYHSRNGRIYTNLFYVEAKTTTPLNLPENRGHYHFVVFVDWLIHF